MSSFLIDAQRFISIPVTLSGLSQNISVAVSGVVLVLKETLGGWMSGIGNLVTVLLASVPPPLRPIFTE